MTHKADGEKVEVGDVEAALAGLGYSLKPLDIVLARTGRDAFYSQPDYARRGCAITPGATRWLYEQGVRVMGIDAWGWDGPLGPSSQGGVDPAGARGLLGGPPGGSALFADRAAGQPGGIAGLRLQGGLLPPEDHGWQRRADPSRGDLAGLIRVVAWFPSSTARATTSPPWGLSGCTRLMAENTDWDGGA